MKWLQLVEMVIRAILLIVGRADEFSGLIACQRGSIVEIIADKLGINDSWKSWAIIQILLENKDVILDIVQKIMDLWADDGGLMLANEDMLTSLQGILRE